MGSEAKGIEASLEYCRCQLLTVCGSGAIKLRRIGLKLEDAVTVGVAHAGNCFQFFGFYLVEPSFPVTVALTRVYNLSSSNDDVNEVAIWFARCLDLVVDVAQLAGNQGLVTQDISDVRINGDGYFFFKPIRSSQELRCQEFTPSGKSSFQLRLNQFMRVYMRIDDLNRRNGNISDFVDFPLGAITVPDTDTKNDDRTIDTSLQQFAKGLKALVWRHFPMFDLLDSRPLIIFPQLNATDWHNTRPNKADEQKYLSALCEAIDFLNNAEVAHLDLRPANIMWTIANGNMKIKVIDFEDAVIFGNTILQSFIDLSSGIEDYRYPFNPAGKLSTIAAVEHNAYFAHCITAWLEKSAEPLDFDGFMMGTRQGGGRNAAQSFFRR